MVQHHRSGLTLAEVMMVLVLVLLVVALVVPQVHQALAVQRRVACAGNLEKLGQACAMARMGGRSLPAPSWPVALAPLVGHDRGVFLCPEDLEPSQPRCALYLRWFCRCMLHRHWRLELAEDHAGWVYKMSRRQWVRFQSSYEPGKPYDHPGYRQDNDPTTYYYAVAAEPHHGPVRNHRDQMFLVRERETYMEIYPIRGATSVFLRLYADLGDGELTEIVEHLEKFDGELAATVPYAPWRTSYGMSSAVKRMASGSRRVLLLDYERVVARGADDGPQELDDWTDENLNEPRQYRPEGPPTFARHFARINVLYGDGAVHLRASESLDPNLSPANRQAEWNP
ncbi:MAG TPA: hypothetical protein VM695_05470 [Phycisphaerae bacterium]|nr:hypothetical protein [Phycisphaerae bacterium]